MQSSIRMIRQGLMSFVIGTVLCAGAPTALAVVEAGSDQATFSQGKSLFDIDFPGGSLAELAVLLEEKDARTDIFVQKDAVDFPVPPISMQKVDMSACIWMLDHLKNIRENGDRGVVMTDTYAVPGGALLVVLGNSYSGPVRSSALNRNDARARSRRLATAESARNKSIATASIGYLISSGMTNELLLATIDQMQSLQGKEVARAEVLIADGSSIIMVKGNQDQIDQIWSLLEAMEDSLQYRADGNSLQDAIKDVRFECGVKPLDANALDEMSGDKLRERLQRISSLRRQFRGQDECQAFLLEQFASTMTAIKAKVSNE